MASVFILVSMLSGRAAQAQESSDASEASVASPLLTQSPQSPLPPLLKPWEAWVLWGEDHRACPLNFEDPSKHVCFWPSELQLEAGGDGGAFRLRVSVFKAGYVSLPGSAKVWPQEVKGETGVLPVLQREGKPVVFLAAGEHELSGRFAWKFLPGSLQLPREIGVLALTLNGEVVPAPSWDEAGVLWLQRGSESSETAQDFLSRKVYALLEDGEPLWFNLKVELLVSGKSREEVLGRVVPEGWRLTAVQSPLPVAIDNDGKLKAQVRTGKWIIDLKAVRLTSPSEVVFGTAPVSDEIFLAFKAAPELRTIDLEGIAGVDVSQLAFPAEWSSYPVYRWETAAPFRLEERLRGMGGQRPPGLTLERRLWLGKEGFTFFDRITGKAQEIWRLDVLPGQKLGAVRHDGEGQLITLNPQSGVAGVELRRRDVRLEAIGQIAQAGKIAATGWDADVEKASVALNLPPGWRLFSVSGADYVRGDWVTAWTLLDLFLVLLFAFAVFRLWSLPLALLAFATLVLSYHEPESPNVLWLLLLIPLGLQRVVPAQGWGKGLVAGVKWVLLVALVCSLFPFIVGQIRAAIYPQLEEPGGNHHVFDGEVASFSGDAGSAFATQEAAAQYADSFGLSSRARPKRSAPRPPKQLDIDPSARVQTGPAVPQWKWREVTYGWNGPVSRTQEVRFHFIPLWLERGLMVLRVLLPLALLGLLLKAASRKRRGAAGAIAAATLLFNIGLSSASAQSIPDEAMLNTLKERLLAVPDEAQAKAEIPFARVSIDAAQQLQIEAEVHTGAFTAVPLPPRLTGWEARSVTVDGKPQVAIQRQDGSLWIALPAGVHRVSIKGALLPHSTDWECGFALKPRQVVVEAPGWKVSGLSPDGVPEAQLFLTREQKTEAAGAEYDRVETTSVVRIERTLDLGLAWQVHTRVVRLTPPGKAVALRIPLLAGENILTSDITVEGGYAEVRLGAQQKDAAWTSELSRSDTISLSTRSDDSWVERWTLRAASRWNVRFSGLAPIFTPGVSELLPVWHPWPGESAELEVRRPEAQEGATLTIQSSSRTIELGQRQQLSKLTFSVECSIGEDFTVALPDDAEVLALQVDGQAMPIRRSGGKLVIPLRAGKHSLNIDFREEKDLATHTTASAISLPVEGANAETVIEVPRNRWILFAHGPLMGPAVLYWGVLAAALVAGLALSRVRGTPLKIYEWVLLSIGLVECIKWSIVLPLFIVGWLFLLAWRGRDEALKLPAWVFNLFQLFLIGLTGASIVVFIIIAFNGLLGTPSMMIEGNGSSAFSLKWYEAAPGTTLPQPGLYTVSIWWYRLLMLLWALWLASALVRWLGWGWKQFSKGGIFRKMVIGNTPPPAGKV